MTWSYVVILLYQEDSLPRSPASPLFLYMATSLLSCNHILCTISIEEWNISLCSQAKMSFLCFLFSSLLFSSLLFSTLCALCGHTFGLFCEFARWASTRREDPMRRHLIFPSSPSRVPFDQDGGIVPCCAIPRWGKCGGCRATSGLVEVEPRFPFTGI